MKKYLVPLLLAAACAAAFVSPVRATDPPAQYPWYWALDRVEQQHLPVDGLSIPLDATGVTVYVVDTGINANSPEFCAGTDPACPTKRVRNGYTAYRPQNLSPIYYENGNNHGTAVASLIGGNTFGVTRNVNLVNVKVTVGSGATPQQLIDGLDFVLTDATVPNPLKVVNISLLYPANAAIDQKVIDLISAGITVVVGAGDGTSAGAVDACGAGSPARLGLPGYVNNPGPYSTITVSATMLDANLAQDARVERPGDWFANDGPCVDLFAPGDQVDSVIGKFGGTSASAPYVTGLVARLLVGNINNPHPKTPTQIEATVKGLASRDLVLNANVAPTPNRFLWLPTPSHHPASRHGDFNSDGYVDLLLHNSGTGYAAVWAMSGTAYQTTINLPGILNTAYQIASAADFNDDGYADILWHNGSTGANAIWLMNGAVLASVVNLPALPADPSYEIRGTGDFNGDGHPDIVIRNRSTELNAVWLMNGTAYSQAVDLLSLAAKFELSGVGDFNDDGSADLLWRNTETGANAVWLMHGTEFSSIVNLPSMADLANHVVSVADLNADGKPDIVWRNPATGANAIWIMDGGTYVQTVNLPNLTAPGWDIKGPK